VAESDQLNPTEEDMAARLREALASGDDRRLRAALVAGGSDPALLADFGRAVGSVVGRPGGGPSVDVGALEGLLDGWAAPPSHGGGAAEAVRAGAAVAAYGEVGAVRPDWWDDEIAKIRRAAGDPRAPVREAVAVAVRRLLAADRERTAAALRDWADDGDPLVAETAGRLRPDT